MIFVDVAGDVRVAEAFNRADSWVRERFKALIQREADGLKIEIQSTKLSGTPGPKRKKGDPLGVGSVLAARTGKLRDSMVARSFEYEKTFAVRVFPTASKQRARYGFMLGTGKHDTIDVKSYARSAPERDRFSSAHVSAKGKIRAIKRSSGVEFVKAARRMVNLNRRPFTSAVLLDRKLSITERMQAEANQVAQELQAQVNGISGGEGI